ncbi:ADAMTS5 [Mytilus coruscus]|uniref:ADAMTS5 n=1 Tax=Mytilus coruscus TaxID=42192 RepID=A0A6J8B6F6_MYTCO|nr:ADAMTS5 [Mytilus coruscus]
MGQNDIAGDEAKVVATMLKLLVTELNKVVSDGTKIVANGGWSSWGSWGACTVTCGNGQRSRRRFCNNPMPASGGASCQGEEYDYNSCPLSACAVKSHIYGETHVNHTYQNDQQSAKIEVTATENMYIDEAYLVDRYDVSDLTKRFRNKEYFVRSLRVEFKLLKNSASDSKPFNSEYEIVDTGRRKDVNQINLNSSTLEVLYHNNVSVLLEIPQKNLAEQFWTIVDDQCIENIIFLVQENEKVTEFYPTLDDIFRLKNFEIYLNSAERTNKNIMLLTFNLQNKTTQTMRNVKMFKTNVSESPSVQAMCYILDKASEVRDSPVLIINRSHQPTVSSVLDRISNTLRGIKRQYSANTLEPEAAHRQVDEVIRNLTRLEGSDSLPDADLKRAIRSVIEFKENLPHHKETSEEPELNRYGQTIPNQYGKGRNQLDIDMTKFQQLLQLGFTVKQIAEDGLLGDLDSQLTFLSTTTELSQQSASDWETDNASDRNNFN